MNNNMSLIVDFFKVQLIKRMNIDSNIKLEMAKEIKSDNLKKKVLEYFEEEDKIEIIKTIESDIVKKELLDSIPEEYNKIEIIETIKSDLVKKGILNDIPKESDRIKIAITIKDDEIKEEIAENMDREYAKVRIVETIEDDDKKISFVRKLDNEILKEQLIESIEDDSKKITQIKELTNNLQKINAIKTIKDDGKILEMIDVLDIQTVKCIRKARDTEFIKENIECFIKKEVPDLIITKDDFLENMYNKNNEVVKNIDFRILQDKYKHRLGEEKISLLSCYDDVQNKVLELDDKKLFILSKCTEHYTNKNNTDEWTSIFNDLLNNIESGKFEQLFNSINTSEKMSDKDVDILIQILQDEENWCEINNVNQIERFYEIKQNKCINIIESQESTLEDKKVATVQKIFGQNVKYSETMIDRFGSDINNLPDSQSKNYVLLLKKILNAKNDEEIGRIFKSYESINQDKYSYERKLKNEYSKLFNEDLYVPSEKDLIDKENNIYEAGTEFKILMTSVAPFTSALSECPENYKESWNRPAIDTQHFCTSYIRNDMIGTPPIPWICYGFLDMKEDSLMASSTHNMEWSKNEFVSRDKSKMQIYKTPENQINNTTALNVENQFYNEMDFRRNQGGQKKQPDYILVFKENGNIPNMIEAKRASKQWEDMPIVVVNKDKCLQAEREKVEKMIEQYKKDPSEILRKEIKQKIRNNSITRRNFGVDIKDKEILDENLVEEKSCDLLDSAIKSTEETTRTDAINDQKNKIVQLQKERMQSKTNENVERE